MIKNFPPETKIYRFVFLLLAASISIVLYISYKMYLTGMFTSPTVVFTICSLPVIILLWIYRTHDTQRNIDLGFYTSGLKLLLTPKKNTDGNIKTQDCAMGLLILSKLRQQNKFIDSIDIATSSGIDLSKANLQKAKLMGIDLSRSSLHQTDLRGADLSGVIIERGGLQNAKTDKTTVLPAGFT